jgi:hypothetical protein
MTAAGEAAVTTKAEVKSVDFYPAGAKFVFQIRPNLDEENDGDENAGSGKGDFEFILPGAFDAASIRLLTQDGATSARMKNIVVKRTPPEELEPLKKIAAEKRRELKLWQGRKEALSQALIMVRHAALSADVNGEGYFSYIEEARAERLRYELEQVDLEIGMEKAAEELRSAEKDLEIFQSEVDSKRPSDDDRAVRVSGTTSELGPILFEAYTYAAGWSVNYNMNLDSATGLITAKMQAIAWQKTGLNLGGEFFFHTRHPSASVEPPEVLPMPVQLRVQPNLRKASSNSVVRDLLEESFAPLPESSLSIIPAMSETLANVSVKGTGALKGDGTPEDLLLGRFEFASTPLLISVPEQNREAWIVASLDSIPMPLLPGVAELAVDGTGSGKTNIQEFGLRNTLPFGMAQRVTAKKEPLIKKASTSWLGKEILEDGYTLEITNGLETEREILVKDRLPLPVDERVQLEVAKVDPAPAERDKDNKLTWKLTLGPGETQKIVVEYTLRYPSGESLQYPYR